MTRAVSALLAKSANYCEVLELRSCDAPPRLVEIRIPSWYRDAKKPESPQARFRTQVAPEALLGPNNALEAFLTRSSPTVNPLEG